jgi:predicted HicB family RNase H-like nuclease
MKYKGYEAIIEYDEVDRLFFGRVINTRDIISFDGTTVEELQQSFEAVIDEYLEDCQQEGKEPDKVFSGQFNLRISPELHRQISLEAKKKNLSLNSFVEEVLKKNSVY